ncbi:MAG: OmpA family protein [Desulfobulbaceae bacterium]|nr:OmpA family protein [Desulfobulbaceae bacterium]
MKHLIFIAMYITMVCASLLFLAPAMASSPRDNAKCESNPLFEPFPKSYLDICERSRFTEIDLRRWDNPAKRSGAEHFKMEGEYWYYVDRIENGLDARVSLLEIQRNFENAIKAAKGSVIYTNPDSSVEYHISRKDGEWWGIVKCGSSDGKSCGAIMHRFVRLAPMEQSMVVSSGEIAKSIVDEGKAVFYGLYFDTDQAVLKPESTPTLTEIAKWLKDNPGKDVFIVGHTDMQGSVDHNLTLSRSRAEAVVTALAKQHGIKPERLKAEGVASFAPVSNNTAEAGRAKNRRVEMVLR